MHDALIAKDFFIQNVCKQFLAISVISSTHTSKGLIESFDPYNK